jgi:hypothetical protein
VHEQSKVFFWEGHCLWKLWNQNISEPTSVRFQVLTAVSMMFRIVFWDVLPCKMIVDRRFRGAYCFHHQGQPFYTALHSRRQFWTSEPTSVINFPHGTNIDLFYCNQLTAASWCTRHTITALHHDCERAAEAQCITECFPVYFNEIFKKSRNFVTYHYQGC